MFSARRAQSVHDQDALPAQLDQPIGPLTVEWGWVNKTWACLPEARRA